MCNIYELMYLRYVFLFSFCYWKQMLLLLMLSLWDVKLNWFTSTQSFLFIWQNDAIILFIDTL